MKSHYLTLGCDRAASTEELRTAWKRLASQWHPDKFPNATPEDAKKFADYFAGLSEAWEALSDTKRRREYDAQLDLLTRQCVECQGAGRIYERRGLGPRKHTTCRACQGAGRVERRSN